MKIFLAKGLTTSSNSLELKAWQGNWFSVHHAERPKETQMTNATQTSRNESMYGFSDIDSYIESVKESITYQFTGGNMVVAGLMSDAQELMSFGDTERARQTLNIAKTIMFKIMDGDLIGTRSTR